ncbi:MAG: hybrid sensor histidine kinase/response regulator [Verrucomicrobiales bacterium]|nr:hybrid sensor histidine kinase/response regulator [Verrucomicrobiales bacterium]
MPKIDPSSGTILIVDDLEKNIQVAGATLTAFNYEIMVASNGEKAIERVSARKPDLILLDILMPGLDGFEVCAALKNNRETRDIPIIFLSANDDKNIVVRALESGGVDFITKPFNKAELIARVRTHMELKQARDALDMMVDKREEFIAMMAHDLKNPLSGIQFSSRLLGEMKDTLPESAVKLASSITEATDRTIELMQDFLNEIRESKTTFEVRVKNIDLIPVLRKVAQKFQATAGQKSIKINLDLPETAVMPVSGDTFAIGRVFDNLLSNAIKFTHPDSEVEIVTDIESRVVRFCDRGPGLTEDDRKKLFEQYTRLSASPTGGETSTGLGLSISKRLCELMNATIEAEENRPEGGACFAVTLAPPKPE